MKVKGKDHDYILASPEWIFICHQSLHISVLITAEKLLPLNLLKPLGERRCSKTVFVDWGWSGGCRRWHNRSWNSKTITHLTSPYSTHTRNGTWCCEWKLTSSVEQCQDGAIVRDNQACLQVSSALQFQQWGRKLRPYLIRNLVEI